MGHFNLTGKQSSPLNSILKREHDAAYEFHPELIAMPGTRTTAASNISLLLLFLKNRFNHRERPGTGTLINVSWPPLYWSN
jgi:hypothetical protein